MRVIYCRYIVGPIVNYGYTLDGDLDLTEYVILFMHDGKIKFHKYSNRRDYGLRELVYI